MSFALKDLEHEYGHYLQALKYGSLNYNTAILPASLWNAATVSQTEHRSFWTEKDANTLAIAFFGSNSDIANDPVNFPHW